MDTINLPEPEKYYLINIIIGLLSSVVDNVPLVAAGRECIHSNGSLFLGNVGLLCRTGGSILIIGSAAGVAVMGMEKIDFIWYLKRISGIALIGYLAGAGAFIGEKAIRKHFEDNKKEQSVEVKNSQKKLRYIKRTNLCWCF